MSRLEEKNSFDGNLVYGLKRFVSLTNRDSHMFKRMREASKFIDTETGLLKKEFSQKRNCPLCGSADSYMLFVKEGASHVSCQSCRMVYVNLVLNDEALLEYYKNESSYTNILLNETQLELDRKKFRYGLKLIENYKSNNDAILDLGCGPGIFLEEARSMGHNVVGLELNKECIKRLKELNIDVLEADLPQAIENGWINHKKIGAVTLWTVLEHILNPLDLLKDVSKVLPKGGCLLVLVPNIDALSNKILHASSSTFSVTHVNLFGAKTLRKILELAGFQVVELETILSMQEVIKSHLNYGLPPEKGTILDAISDFLTPQIIHEHLGGYCLLALAIKK